MSRSGSARPLCRLPPTPPIPFSQKFEGGWWRETSGNSTWKGRTDANTAERAAQQKEDAAKPFQPEMSVHRRS
jgi:hypothetical protein